MNRLFETVLWESRLVVLVAVVTSLITGLSMFFMATVDAYYMVSHLFHYASPELTSAERLDLRNTTVTHVVEVVDGYLLATVLLIFAFGLYELFIKKLDQAEGASAASSVLVIRSLDDLKGRLAKVILMILIVKFFEYGLSMSFNTPMDLLTFAAGIALIGLALYLSHKGEGH